MGELSVPCGHCGAALQVDADTSWVTCRSCESFLEVVRKGDALYTRAHTVGDKAEEGPADEAPAVQAPPAKARSSGKSHDLGSATRWIKYGFLPGFALYLFSVGMVFELLTGTPLAWGTGMIWLFMIVMVPLVAPLLSVMLLVPVWALLKFIKPLRRPVPASLLIGAGCAAWVVMHVSLLGSAAMAEAGAEMLSVLRSPGNAFWADYIDALIFVGQLTFMALVALGCTIGGSIALVGNLKRGPGDRLGAGLIGVSGLLAVASMTGLVFFITALVGNLPLVAAIGRVQTGDPAVRLAAVEELAQLADARGTVYLIERLEEDDRADVRTAAAAALGEQIGPGSASLLIKRLPEDDPELVMAALDGLKSIQARTELIDRQRLDWSHELAKLLRSEQAPIRRRAADLLITMGPQCTSSVTGQLSRKGETRALAIEILGAVGDERAAGSLVWQLQEPGAVEALRAVTKRVGVALLFREAFSRSAPAWHRIKGPVSEVVLGMGDGALDQLKGAACDMKMRSEGRKFARKLVRDIGGDAAFETTVHCIVPQLAEENSRDRDIGRYELYRIGKGAVGPLIVAMEGMDPTAREEAGKVLKKLTRKRFGADAAKWMEWWKKVQGTGAWR